MADFPLDFLNGTPSEINLERGPSPIPLALSPSPSFPFPPTGTLTVGPVTVNPGTEGQSFVVSPDTAPAFTRTGANYTVIPNQGTVFMVSSEDPSGQVMSDRSACTATRRTAWCWPRRRSWPPRRCRATSVTPGSGNSFSVVIIQGSGLSHVRSVSFGSKRAPIFIAIAGRVIIALAPSEPTGTVDVTVTTRDGTSPASAADRFSFLN